MEQIELSAEQQQHLSDLNAAIDAAAEIGDAEFFDAVANKDDYLETIGYSEPT